MITDAVSALPEWAAGVVAVLLVSSWCLPKILRALDDRRIAKTVCEKITTEQCAVEALRIRSSPRRTIGRPLPPSTTPTPPPASAGGGVGRQSARATDT